MLHGGSRNENSLAVNDSIKCAKSMKKREPAYYFVLTVASFLHYYMCMHIILQLNAFICGQSLVFMYSTKLCCKSCLSTVMLKSGLAMTLQ